MSSTGLRIIVLAVAACLTQFGMSRPATAGVVLNDLFNGGTISVGRAVFTDWQLLSNFGTITPDFTRIDVQSSLDEPGQIAISFNGNGQLIVPPGQHRSSLGIVGGSDS